MRTSSAARLVTLTSAIALFACKDTTALGPTSTNSESPGLSSPVFAKLPPGCRHVKGDFVMTTVPSPNDPLGRTVGPVKGGLKGAETTVLTSIVPGGGGEFNVTSSDVLVAGPTDIITATSAATWTPIPSAPFGTFAIDATQTINGGTGSYDGATGTLHVTGTGYDLFGPNAGPGHSYFDLTYDGTVCT